MMANVPIRATSGSASFAVDKNNDSKAVALIVFNRPDLIEAVLAPVRKYAPKRIYLIADGPRTDRPGEDALCAASRAAALGAINWPCEVIRVFSEANLGCRNRVISGLDVVFQQETEAIILEDDTVANDDFLPYCERMLNAHRDNEQIFSITGTKLFSSRGQQDSAFLSRFSHIWGWATWRRSWLKYDRDLACLGRPELTLKMQRLFSARHVRHWERVLGNVRDGRVNTWDYQWQASLWMADACCLTPPRNLISNLGFRPDATHTAAPGIYAQMKTYPLLNKNTTFLPISRSYEWIFQNMFHNANRPLRWLRDWMVNHVAREETPTSAASDWTGLPAKLGHSGNVIQ